MSENTVYSDAISTVGEQHCYVMPLSQKSKVVGKLLASDATSDFNLYLYEYDPSEGVLNVVDGGEVPAGSMEVAYAVTEEPSYILVAELMSGAGGSYNFLGNSYTGFDAYEPNDSGVVGEFPTISVGQKVIGNLDNAEDVDYFGYTLKSTEDKLKIKVSGSAEHQTEILLNSTWQVLSQDTLYTITATPSDTIYVRTLAASGATTSALNNYQIQTSYATVADFSDIDLWTTDNLTELAVSGVIEAHSNLGVGGNVVDSSGNPIEGETMVIQVPADGQYYAQTAVTNAIGSFSTSFDLPGCTGVRTEKWSNYGSPATLWEIYFDLWEDMIIVYPLSQQDDPNRVELKLSYAHICKERVIGSR